jgi:hypothetical protein
MKLEHCSRESCVQIIDGLTAKMEAYKEMMDATAKDADRAYELLRRAENEMRYAGWNKYESDNSARNGVYEQVKEFLK